MWFVLPKAALEFDILIQSSPYFSCYLIVLQLCYNQLTGSIPTQLDSLKKLNVLALQSNLLTGAIPANLGNLGSLMRLDLSFNELFGSIPAKLAVLRWFKSSMFETTLFLAMFLLVITLNHSLILWSNSLSALQEINCVVSKLGGLFILKYPINFRERISVTFCLVNDLSDLVACSVD